MSTVAYCSEIFVYSVDRYVLNLPAFDVNELDFLFLIARTLGFNALRKLLAVNEEGEDE